MSLANQTRPDTPNAVRAIARYACTPKEKHWRAAIGIVEYVSCTSEFGISFRKTSGLELVAFADVNYASIGTDRRSVSGGVYHMHRCLRGLILEEGEKCHAFDHRGRICSYCRHSQGGDFHAVCMCGVLCFRASVHLLSGVSRITRGRFSR